MTEGFMHRAVSTRPAWMELDLSALKDNYEVIRHRVGPGTKVFAVVKANAYGHGAVEVARTLRDVDVYALALGSIAEAVAIRRAGIDAKILIYGSTLPEAASELLAHDLVPTVDTPAAAQVVAAAARSPVPIYVKVDCGFGRLGVPVEEAEAFVMRVAGLPNLVIEGVYTHLPFSDGAGAAWARQRLAIFNDLVAALGGAGLEIPVTQAISSAGIAAGLDPPCTAVACGHLLYGLNPIAADVADAVPIRPVLHAIKCRLIHVARLPAGRAADRDAPYLRTRVAATGVVPVGIRDGYRGPVPGTTAVMLMRGRRIPVLRVCLENTVLDLSGIERPETGEQVTVLGVDDKERITLEEISGWQATSPLNVLMSFDQHFPYREAGGEAASA